MKEVDLQINGKKTFDYPDTLNKKINDIYDQEGSLKRSLLSNAQEAANFTIRSEMTDDNGEPLQIPVDSFGWGSNKKIVFDKKTGQRYYERFEAYDDYKFLKRYIKFLSKDFRETNLKSIEASFKIENEKRNIE